MEVQHFDELLKLLPEYGLETGDICIVGSAVLAAHGEHYNNDLDFAIKPEKRKQIMEQYAPALNMRLDGGFEVAINIEVAINRYIKLGINDEKLFTDKYSCIKNGIRCARIELELAVKTKKSYEKDIRGLAQFKFDYIPDFDWDWFKSLAKIKINKSIADGGKSKLVGMVIHPLRTLRIINKRLKRYRLNKNREKLFSTEMMIQGKMVLSSGTLLSMQYRDNEFAAYDVVATCLSAQKYINGESEPLNCYNAIRQTLDKHALSERDVTYMVDNYPFDSPMLLPPVVVDKNGKIIEGWQLLAASIICGAEYLPVRVQKKAHSRECTKDWLADILPQRNIDEIEKTKHEVFMRLGIYCSTIIWGAALGFAQDIRRDICEEYEIAGEWDVDFTEDTYREFVKEVYAVDQVPPWKVEFKTHELLKYPHKIKFLLFEIPNPQYHEMPRTYSYQCSESMNFKWKVRGCYKHRISDYYTDVILHTGDNPEHNSGILEVVNKYTDMMNCEKDSAK